ncbi:MAG: tetratricopeptide repeat protein [Propionivibrio sp.]|uniref:tetratricopeptide repeat protein n=1 Tax=Propionivibrio sp. TaxID=2212460 RepID=UPI0025D2B3A2|nr:tetratricopeptide repeat protein [Propionivibrio sp.]MBK8894652.1 tetratricopeptide repeat protein [Propionivibrio sp.]
MSLINQMLQDLDARRAAHGVGTKLPTDVRPLPKLETSRLPLILGIVFLLVAAGALAFYQWEIRQEAAIPQGAPVAPALTAPAQPPAPLPVPVAVPQLPAEQASPVVPLLPDMEGSLRLADSLRFPSEPKIEAKPVAATQTAKSATADMKHAGEAKSNNTSAGLDFRAAETVMPKAAGQATKGPMIERTDAAGSPRERVENEYRKAISAVNQGRVAEALDGLRNALRLDSLHVASRQLLVRLLIEAKRPDEAAQVLQDGLQGQPAQIGWAMSLARLQADRGDLAGAWQTLDQTSPAAGGNADYQGFMAHVLQRLGRNKEAAKHFQTAARLAPGDGRWWLGLGLTLEADGNAGEAREMFLRARQSGNLGPELIALIEQKLHH